MVFKVVVSGKPIPTLTWYHDQPALCRGETVWCLQASCFCLMPVSLPLVTLLYCVWVCAQHAYIESS